MGTSMTAMLVVPEDVRHPAGVTTTIPRDEIEEALASDAPLDLSSTWRRSARATRRDDGREGLLAA